VECIDFVLGNVNMWNDLGFSLYVMLSVCYVVVNSDEWMKYEMGVSTDWCVAVEQWRLSSIRVYLCQLLD